MTSTSSWAEIYARIQQLLLLQERIHNGAVYPRWIGRTDTFWYERSSPAGREICIVQGSSGERRTAFAVSAIAAALGRPLDAEIDPKELILSSLKVEREPARASFDAFGKSWVYDYESGTLEETALKGSDKSWVVSPDGRMAAILRDHNLWVREIETGE